MKYICNLCGYVYDEEAGDPDNGIAPGTAFEDLPEDWVCPVCGMGTKWEDVAADWVCPLCGAGKDEFSPAE